MGDRPLLAGGSPELDGAAVEHPTHIEVGLVAVLAALVTLAAGVYPDPLFDLVRDAGSSFTGLF
jgi:hypothetical protein